MHCVQVITYALFRLFGPGDKSDMISSAPRCTDNFLTFYKVTYNILTFSYFAVIILVEIDNNTFRRLDMFNSWNRKYTIKVILWIVSAVAIVTAAITAYLVVKEQKKKEDEELEEYLDYSIQ